MALVLSLKVGGDFYVSDRQYKVASTESKFEFWLLSPEGSMVYVTGDDWIELEHGVWAKAGLPITSRRGLVRIMLDAKGHQIVRGDLKRRDQGI